MPGEEDAAGPGQGAAAGEDGAKHSADFDTGEDARPDAGRWDREAIAYLGTLGTRFTCWRWEQRGDQWTKPPVTPGGKYASSTDPTTWCSLSEAIAGVEKDGIDGIGFVFNGDGIVGTDLDGCRDPQTGEIARWAQKIINSLRSYTEVSPSGTGVKIFSLADPVPTLLANRRTVGEAANGPKPPAIEVYTKDRFFCLTGEIVSGVPDEIVDATEAFERVAAWVAKGKSAGDAGGLPQAFLDLLARDDTLRDAWEHGTKLGSGTDTSASGLDVSLAFYLRPYLDDGEIATVLRQHRHGQIGSGKLKGKSADRRIERILAELPIRQGQAQTAQAQTAQAPDPIVTIDWPAHEGKTPPPRRFVVGRWLPIGCATSLYAPGGSGKSMLAQILGSAVSAGHSFLGLITMRAPVLGIFCEDDDEELWRRQHRINPAIGIGMRQLGDLHSQGRLGMPNLLMTFPQGKPPTMLAFLGEIEAKARAIGAKLIILDNAAQLFGGEENSRAEVTAFLNALNGLARRLDAAVLLLGHPPKSGAEYSGSTAWHSVVRCMWTLGPVVEMGEEGKSSDLMVLTRHKANYAPRGEELRLRWVDGVLRRAEGDDPTSAMDGIFRRHNAKGAFLAALDELTAQKRSVSHSSHAGNYAPKAMRAAGLAADYTVFDLKRAMNDLFADRAIIATADLWRGADRKWVVGIARRPPAATEPKAGEPEGGEPEMAAESEPGVASEDLDP